MKNRIYSFKNKSYFVLAESKMKIDGEWQDCVIYVTLYRNPYGWIWIRPTNEFYEKFTKKILKFDSWLILSPFCYWSGKHNKKFSGFAFYGDLTLWSAIYYLLLYIIFT